LKKQIEENSRDHSSVVSYTSLRSFTVDKEYGQSTLSVYLRKARERRRRRRKGNVRGEEGERERERNAIRRDERSESPISLQLFTYERTYVRT